MLKPEQLCFQLGVCSIFYRPTSLLVKENGLVRFRQDGDEDADPVVLSTEDELDLQDPEVMGNPFAAALAQHQRNLFLEEYPQDRKGK